MYGIKWDQPIHDTYVGDFPPRSKLTPTTWQKASRRISMRRIHGLDVCFPPPNYKHLTIGPLLLLIQDAARISDSVKLRPLEWKTRFDILHYVVRWAPPLQLGGVSNYTSKDTAIVNSREELPPRFINMPDGHVINTARALGLAQHLSQHFLDRP
ncbi:hypothetical protein HDV63DRAFT_407861 [Trichoderma sp. SZMC 28014]